MSDEMDRQQDVDARMRKKREPETVRVQLRKVTRLVFCPNTGKLGKADNCKKCPRFHGWFQDDNGVFVKCSEVTIDSKAIVVNA